MAIYSDFPMKNGDFPWQNVSLPEGNMKNIYDKVCEWKLVTSCLEVVIYQLSYNTGPATC